MKREDKTMDLKGRHFLTLKDFTPEEIIYLLDLAAELKEKKKKGILVDHHRGKNVALIFEKDSTRTLAVSLMLSFFPNLDPIVPI